MNTRGFSKITAIAASLALAAATVVVGTGPAVAAGLDPPTNLRITDLTPNKVTLAWDPPDGAVRYGVIVRGPTTYLNQTAHVDEPTATFHLHQGRTYLADVIAYGADGQFSDRIPLEDRLEFTMPVDPDDPPVSVPANVTAEVDPDTLGIVVAWEPSTSEAGVVRYWLQVQELGGGTRYFEADETTTTLFIGLGKTYVVRVGASDAAKRNSDYSDPVEVTTPNAPPPSTPENVHVTTSPGVATINWDTPTSGAGAKEYWLTFRNAWGGTVTQMRTTDTTATYERPPGTAELNVSVVARDWYNRSSGSSDPVAFTLEPAEDWVPPSAPTNFRASAAPGGVLFEWDEPVQGIEPFTYHIHLDGTHIETIFGKLELLSPYFVECTQPGQTSAEFTVTATSFGIESPPSNSITLCF